jgi:hypothetical protein
MTHGKMGTQKGVITVSGGILVTGIEKDIP